MVRQFQAMVDERSFDDPVAAKLAAFLRDKREIVDDLIKRAERLASMLQAQDEPFVLCHADIHAGNVLIDAHGRLYVVDWDTLIMAPKERDLMYVGGGQFLDRRSPEEEDRLFYQGYGETAANPVALAYYRYERIVQDIAAYCEALLLTDEGGEDRENSLRQLTRQFGERGVISLAYRADRNPASVYA
jgi:spectinomycin phosphotransferase